MRCGSASEMACTYSGRCSGTYACITTNCSSAAVIIREAERFRQARNRTTSSTLLDGELRRRGHVPEPPALDYRSRSPSSARAAPRGALSGSTLLDCPQHEAVSRRRSVGFSEGKMTWLRTDRGRHHDRIRTAHTPARPQGQHRPSAEPVPRSSVATPATPPALGREEPGWRAQPEEASQSPRQPFSIFRRTVCRMPPLR